MTAEVLGNPVETPPWIPTDESFAARLALVRWRMGWNIKEAALACGVPAASWRLWELENAQPRRLVEIAARIAERTGVDYGWLLAGPCMAGVYRPTGPSASGTGKASQPTLARVRPAARSGPSGSPDRVRPADNRPPSHPGIPVQSPRHRRPAPIRPGRNRDAA